MATFADLIAKATADKTAVGTDTANVTADTSKLQQDQATLATDTTAEGTDATALAAAVFAAGGFLVDNTDPTKPVLYISTDGKTYSTKTPPTTSGTVPG